MGQVSVLQVEIRQALVFRARSDLVKVLNSHHAAGCATGVVCGVYSGLSKPSSAGQYVSSGTLGATQQECMDGRPPVPYSPCGKADQGQVCVGLSILHVCAVHDDDV